MKFRKNKLKPFKQTQKNTADTEPQQGFTCDFL